MADKLPYCIPIFTYLFGDLLLLNPYWWSPKFCICS